MRNYSILGLISALLLSSCEMASTPQKKETSELTKAQFDWFNYSGEDEVFNTPLKADEYRNPILNGFYPDPSIVRVDKDYYMVNSTFGLFPGLPVWHSRDLVNWKQLGNAVDRTDMMSFDGIHLGQNGLYAPTIEYNNGLFYIFNTCVACGGNFALTAKNPAGPWSDPIWMPDVGGIDPQALFDEDGRVYVVNHEDPEGESLYDGHKAIWIREVDPNTLQDIGPKKMLVDGGVNIDERPGYVEGPHLYKLNGYYYLSAAEGGTGLDHRQVIFRSRTVFGPYESNPNNPILTQRGLSSKKKYSITSTGHADLFEDTKGDWWAVFLGTRNFDDIHFATGRETFMLPVTWEDDWPVILESGKRVPYVVKKPNLPEQKLSDRLVAGNFTIKEDFDGELPNYWSFVRMPQSSWWDVDGGALHIEPRSETMGQQKQPSIVARRIHHMNSAATTRVKFNSEREGDEAGLMAFQNDEHYFAIGLGENQDGQAVIRVRHRAGAKDPRSGKLLSETPITISSGQAIDLQMKVDGAQVDFGYSLDGKTFTPAAKSDQGNTLSTMRAGGFTGAFFGLYAETGEPRFYQSAAQKAAKGLDETGRFNLVFGSVMDKAIVDAPDMAGGKAMRLTVTSKKDNPWDVMLSAPNLLGGVKEGDEVTLSFAARAVDEAGKIAAMLQRAGAPYEAVISEEFTVSTQWQIYTVKAPAALSLDSGEVSIVIHTGLQAQTLEFGNFTVKSK